jgi:hypothetical protein
MMAPPKEAAEMLADKSTRHTSDTPDDLVWKENPDSGTDGTDG